MPGKLTQLSGRLTRIKAQFPRPTEAKEGEPIMIIAEIVNDQFDPPRMATVKGRDDKFELTQNNEYRFYGRWEVHHKHGRQFIFQQFVLSQPVSRIGVITYLQKHAPGIGPTLGGRLHDRYGGDAVKMLRTNPAQVAKEVSGVSTRIANEAAKALGALSRFEETTIELTGLFAGKGFPASLVNAAIDRWGIHAPHVIRRDPFCLMVARMPGAGWNRCDRLYAEMGLNPAKTKRQMFCCWHAIKQSRGGDTWIDQESVKRHLGQHIGGITPNIRKAVRLGCRSGWLREREVDGKKWFAIGKNADAESELAGKIREMVGAA